MTKSRRGGRGTPELADLYLIGIGIRGMSQITPETRDVLRHCRKVMHLTNQHRELRRINPRLEDLGPQYWTGEDCDTVYERLVQSVMAEVDKGSGVATVVNGHPLFFDDVHMELLRRAKRKKLRCVVLPGISSLDTLSIDLEIDYGDGLQVYDVNDLVVNRFPLNPLVHTLVLQLNEFDTNVTPDAIRPVKGRFKRLQKYLERFFPPDHRIVIAFSDEDDGKGPFLLKSRLSKLDSHSRRIFSGTTLYLPPLDD